MPPRKRKAEEQAGTTPKKSKKDQLAEARARARAWADEEMKKKAGGSKVSSAKKAPAKSPPAKSPARAPARSPVRASASSRMASPRRASPAARPTKKPVTPKSSASKPSVAQRTAEARARAKVWAAAEAAKKLAGSKKNVRATKPPQEPSRMDSDDDLDMADRKDDMEPDDIESDQDDDMKPVAEPDYDDDDDDDAVVQVVPPARVRPASAPYVPPAAPLPFGSPGRPTTLKNTAAYANKEDLPPTMGQSDVNHHMKNMHEQETQKKLFLERQVQEQVLANAMAQTPQTMEQQDVVKFMQQQQPPQYRQYAHMHPDEYEPKRGRPYVKGLLILAAAGAIVAALVSGNVFGSTSTVEPTTRALQKLPPCFVDNYDYADVENPPKSPFECDKSLKRIPCPGRCADGHLLFCQEKYLTTALDGSRCVLSVSSNETLAQVESLLTNWTTQSFCDLAGVEFARKRSKAPVFPLTKVIENIQVDKAILDLSSDFVVEQEEDGEYFVGLSDEYADTKFVIPTVCWLSLLTVDFAFAAAGRCLGMVISTLSTVFRIGVAYPTVSLVCLVVLLVIIYTRRREALQKKMLVDVANIRQLAYKHMMEETQEHVVLHLRDGIAMDLHPTSKSARSYVILKVWPRVVADVRLDNRIRKTSRKFGGKPRDIWQWVATPSSSRNLQSNQ